MTATSSLEDFLRNVQRRDPDQPEFLQAVREVLTSLWPSWRRTRSTANTPCWSACASRTAWCSFA